MITAIDKNTALVLIDLQEGIVKGDKAHPVKDILEKAAELVSAFRKASLPIVIVTVNPTGAAWTKLRVDTPSLPQSTIAQTVASAAMAVTGFGSVVSEIKAEASDIFIVKKTWTAFFNTPLHEELQKHGITGIVLAGISTSVGVEGTARDASMLGYNISFAVDAMTDRLAEAHHHSTHNIFPRIGELGSTAEIIAKLP